MTEQTPKDTGELLAWMDDGWRALTAELDRLAGTPAEQLRDHQGWTIADHLAHLAAWEASALAVVRRRPRYEGLGIPREAWDGDEDAINARLHAIHEGISFAAARTMLETVHADTVATVSAMPIADLLKPVDHYLPGEPDDPDLRPAGRVIVSNSGQHFTEHLAWIRAQAGA
ncbi:MAG: ClbS/DfsB family four-helix bundle protein [Dehalococcoidia bacterium]|nr:ClbS/DfsB family four-helix bundle protein [Dehalococcoidia bacterium]